MFCGKCGKENPAEAEFCAKCGARLPKLEPEGTEAAEAVQEKTVPVEQTVQEKAVPMKPVSSQAADSVHKIHCPRCKCGKVEMTNETITTSTTDKKGYGAGKGCLGWLLFGPIGLLCGLCGKKSDTTTTTTQTNTSYLCQECGYKFLKIDDIVAEIDKQIDEIDREPMTLIGAAIVWWIILSLISGIGWGDLAGAFVVWGIIFIMAFLCGWKDNAADREERKESLQEEKKDLLKNGYDSDAYK